MILDRGVRSKPTSGSSTTALAASTVNTCTNPNCKAKKRSTHSTSNCYWPGIGKEGQFPPNFGQRARANIAYSTETSIEHFVLSARVPGTPGISGIVIDDEITPTTALVGKGFRDFNGGKVPTFINSRASDTMFVSKNDFNNYKSLPSRSGDSAKEVDGTFDIIGEGTVFKHYLVDSKEKKLTYTHAIHTPTLNTNLISIGTFDKAGLTVTFGGGRGLVRKSDRTIVLSARLTKGMYVVDELVHDTPSISAIPLTMTSLSTPVPLEQWHRRLTHCSPLTILEMSKGNLVDGLVVSGNDLHGKCKDCIVERQTHRPFDGKSETNLDPLELVSFDLWGPSRVQTAGGKIYFMPVIDGGTSFKYGAYLSDKSDLSTVVASHT